MKKLTAVFMAVLLICGILAGCGGKADTSANNSSTSQTPKSSESSSVSLAKIKQAAKDAGYTVKNKTIIFDSGIVEVRQCSIKF